METGLKITFHGGVGTVTGANFLLETSGAKILVDCGLIQGPKWERKRNFAPFLYKPEEIDFLFVTHAHIDHIGRIGKLVHEGFKGVIYSTPATRALSVHMLADAASINLFEAKRDQSKPLYVQQDVDKALTLWKTIPYHTNFKFGNEFEVFLKDAGHVLGSAIFEFTHLATKKKIVFTGDLGNSPTPLLRDTESVNDADYLIIESVYGDRVHGGKKNRKENLQKILHEVIKRGGTTIIPVFSLEKTQVLLHELNELIEGGQLPSVPVFFDSPLGIKLTEVYRDESENFNDAVREDIKAGDDIFDFPKLKLTLHNGESKKIHEVHGAKIIVASSGMSEGGRIRSHEEEYLPGANNAFVIIGYQVAGTLGRNIQEGAKQIRIGDKTIPVRAKILTIDGYSSHKDSEGLVDFVSETAEKVKKVFVVMGEPKSAMFLSQRLREYLDVDAIHPDQGQSFEL